VGSFIAAEVGSVSRIVDSELYPRRHLMAARSAFQDHCAVEFEPVAGNRAKVTLTPKVGSGERYRQTVLEFWNYALDAHCQARLG